LSNNHHKMVRTLVLTVALVSLLAGCSGESEPTAAKEASAQPSPSGTQEARGTCPVTFPNGNPWPDREPTRFDHGNGKIWTQLWPYGLIIATPRFVRPDGSIRMKFAWLAEGVEGDLAIRGRRLDAPARPLRVADINGGGFWTSEIIFPTEGCWEVTGAVGKAKLTFVTLVVKASTYLLEEKEG
jgi:hypothetical protein